MKISRETCRYDACGLRGVTLVGIPVSRCATFGEQEVTIPRIAELHRLIAMALARKPARLAPAEIRFLRKYFGWSRRNFAGHMGVTPKTVSRWENGQDLMGVSADRLLRLMVAHREPASDYKLDTLKEVAKGSARPVRMDLKLGRTGWRAAG